MKTNLKLEMCFFLILLQKVQGKSMFVWVQSNGTISKKTSVFHFFSNLSSTFFGMDCNVSARALQRKASFKWLLSCLEGWLKWKPLKVLVAMKEMKIYNQLRHQKSIDLEPTKYSELCEAVLNAEKQLIYGPLEVWRVTSGWWNQNPRFKKSDMYISTPPSLPIDMYPY